MAQFEQANESDFRRLLLSVSPNRAEELTVLLDEVRPIWLLDRDADDKLFQAKLGEPNEIRMGLKCSKRLELHAYAIAALFLSNGKPEQEQRKILAPVDVMLNWAVGVEVTHQLNKEGIELPKGHLLRAADKDIPDHVRTQLSTTGKMLGAKLFRFATAWILFHELGHLKHKHTHKVGIQSYVQEKEADRFATEWLIEAASTFRDDRRKLGRLFALMGMAIPLLWLTIDNVYFDHDDSDTHPKGYDRLFQVLDHVIDRNDEEEYLVVWQLVAKMLVNHMESAGYVFDESDGSHLQDDPRDAVNYLIDRISRFERKNSLSRPAGNFE